MAYSLVHYDLLVRCSSNEPDLDPWLPTPKPSTFVRLMHDLVLCRRMFPELPVERSSEAYLSILSLKRRASADAILAMECTPQNRGAFSRRPAAWSAASSVSLTNVVPGHLSILDEAALHSQQVAE